MTMKSYTYKDYTIEIHQDEFSESPREWDNLGTMALYHRRYDLGDKKQYEDADALRKYLEEHAHEVYQLPIYAYDHGAITISTSPFSCPWDSGQLGVIYVTKEQARKQGFTSEAQVIHTLECEVETYDQFIRGEIYGYKVFDADGEELDSCWGFYGEDGCRQEAESVVDYYDRTTPKQYELAFG